MASSAIGDALKEKNNYHLVIVKSTVLPGTTENYVQKTIEKNPVNKQVETLASLPIPNFSGREVPLKIFFNRIGSS